MLNRFRKFIAGLIALYGCSAWAIPSVLVTHNHTNVESNAFIDGVIPSLYPTKPHSDSRVIWNAVRLACHGHTRGNICVALIKMGTDTPNPIDIGYVTLNLLSGEIQFRDFPGNQEIHANGYRVIINGKAETTLEKE